VHPVVVATERKYILIHKEGTASLATAIYMLVEKNYAQPLLKKYRSRKIEILSTTNCTS
jgi:hypothetical protein